MPHLGEEASDELEALTSIYGDEFEVKRSKAGIPFAYSLHVTPGGGGTVYSEVFMLIKIAKDYPEAPCRYTIDKSKGLSDEEVKERKEGSTLSSIN